MPRTNIWKPLKLAPSRSVTDLSSPAPSAQYERVRTSREVRQAYNARENARATSSGTYVLSRGRQSISAPDLAQSTNTEASTSRASSPISAFEDLYSRSSSPPPFSPTKATGWSSDYPTPHDPTAEHAHYQTTRASQWSKWTTVVVPSLVQPYLAICRRTNNLAFIDREYALPCTCNQPRPRILKVTCVYFDRMSPTHHMFLPILIHRRRCGGICFYLPMHNGSPCSFITWFHVLVSHTPNISR